MIKAFSVSRTNGSDLHIEVSDDLMDMYVMESAMGSTPLSTNQPVSTTITGAINNSGSAIHIYYNTNVYNKTPVTAGFLMFGGRYVQGLSYYMLAEIFATLYISNKTGGWSLVYYDQYGNTNVVNLTTSNQNNVYECYMPDLTEGTTSLQFTIPPSTTIDQISISSVTGEGYSTVTPSPTDNTYLYYNSGYGNGTITATSKQSSINLKRTSIGENVNVSADVLQNGNTTTYNMPPSNPTITMSAGENVNITIAAPAPEVTVDYTNTSTPVVTNTQEA